jgi:hypothetical protein
MINTRAVALSWWRSLLDEQRKKYAKWHGPKDWTFEMINASSSQIEKIYKSENPK